MNFPYNFCNEYNHLSLDIVVNNYKELSKKSYNINENKENVIFFLSFDYKTMPSYYNQMLEVLTKYCKYHNNELYIFNHNKDVVRVSPYWNRVLDYISLSKIYNNDSLIVYLDIDTCINSKYFNMSICDFINSIDKIENRKHDIYIGNDPSPEEFGNAGIIIIRNTEWSKKFLNLWWSKYNPNNWQIVNEKWICKTNINGHEKPCNWARENYEQGEFNKIYRNNEIDSRNHIRILHYSLLSNPNLFLDSFIYHFYGRTRYYKNISINKIYNDYKF